jgi:hypothetical protein
MKRKLEPMAKCPRAKSEMTPCYVKDGDLAVGKATSGWGADRRKVCVGCEYGIGFLRDERQAATQKQNP